MPDIRPATLDDVAAILAISNRAAENTPANFSIEPEPLETWEASYEATHAMYPWFVAEDGDEIVGFARAAPWKGRCAYAYSAEITVYVHEDHQGQGLGKMLYEWLLSTLRAQGYLTVIGGITLPNDASVALHESFGLTRAAVFRSIGWKFEQWHDVGYWQGFLNEPDGPPTELRSVEEAIEAAT